MSGISTLRAKPVLLIAAAAFTLSITGCATVTPPPDRAHWDDVPKSTQCTVDKSGVHAQYTGSLLAAAVGGADIGAAIAYGVTPIFGIGIAAVGIFGSGDASNKYDQIKKCKEFKQYVLTRENGTIKTASSSIETKLSDLKGLLDNGTISDEEYKMLRKKALQDI